MEKNGALLSGHFHTSDTYEMIRPQGRSDWLIAFTLGGEGVFTIRGRETVCRPGDLVLLKPGTPHRYGTRKGRIWDLIWAHFSSPDVDPSLLPDEELFVHHVDNASASSRIYRAFQRLLADSRERGQYWHELCLNALHEILMLVAERQNRRIDARIEETLHLLSHRMREPVRIEWLARNVGLSPSRLSHLFKACTGQSVVEALNGMRVRQAALLLEHTDRSATEVCHDVGFQNYNHFSNQFRKYYGVNPRVFMKEFR